MLVPTSPRKWNLLLMPTRLEQSPKVQVHVTLLPLYFVIYLLFFPSVLAKPLTLEGRMMIIEKRLGELETENAEKKDAIVMLDSTNKNLECNIKDKESAVSILSEEIDTLKAKLRYSTLVITSLFRNLLISYFYLYTGMLRLQTLRRRLP